MKTEDLLLAIGQADTEFLEQSERKTKRRKPHIFAYIAAAVCVLCASVAAYTMSQNNIQDVAVRQTMQGVIIQHDGYTVSVGGSADVTLKMQMPADAPSKVEKFYVPKLMQDWTAKEIITVEEKTEDKKETYLIWENANGDSVIFRQIAAPGYAGQYAIDTILLGYQTAYQTDVKTIGKTDVHTVTIAPSKIEKDGIVAQDEGRQKLYWSDGEYLFIMEVNYDMSEELIAEIFASIEQVDSIAPYQNLVPAGDVEIPELPPISDLMFPTKIPDGWEQTSVSENPISECASYWKFASEPEQMSVIVFTQSTDEEYHNSELILWATSVKNYTEESRIMDGICYTIFTSDNQIQILWQCDGYFFSIDNAGENLATLDDLLAMAQSVE